MPKFLARGDLRLDQLATASTGDLERAVDCERWCLPASVRVATVSSDRCMGASAQQGQVQVLEWVALGRRADVQMGPGMLERFITLFDKPAEDIVSYARRWGTLGICEEHGLPLGHGCVPRGGFRVSKLSWHKYSDSDIEASPHIESIEEWRMYSAAANAMLTIHAHLHSSEIADEELWKTLFRPGPHPARVMVSGELWWYNAPWWNRTPEWDTQELITQLNRWLQWAGVTPYFDINTQTVRFAVTGLFGAISVQLLFVVSGSEGWAICSNPKCRRVYQPPNRRPKSGQRRFCPECRASNIPKLMGNADSRRRSRAAFAFSGNFSGER